MLDILSSCSYRSTLNSVCFLGVYCYSSIHGEKIYLFINAHTNIKLWKSRILYICDVKKIHLDIHKNVNFKNVFKIKRELNDKIMFLKLRKLTQWANVGL